MLSITICNWLVQFKMNSEQKKSAHQVLFKNLNSLDDNTQWLSNSCEQRIVQFVAFPDMVIARLNKEPKHIICQKIEKTFTLEQEIELTVKLCGSLERKKKTGQDGITVLEGKILNEEERHELAKQILLRAGLEIIGLVTQETDNIKFFKNKRVVQIKTFEAYAKCRIVNLESFSAAWYAGVGKRRTWGCGMLRVKE